MLMDKAYNTVTAPSGAMAVFLSNNGPVFLPVLFFYQWHDGTGYRLDAVVSGVNPESCARRELTLRECPKVLKNVFLGFSMPGDPTDWSAIAEEALKAIDDDVEEVAAMVSEWTNENSQLEASLGALEREKEELPGCRRKSINIKINELKRKIRVNSTNIESAFVGPSGIRKRVVLL